MNITFPDLNQKILNRQEIPFGMSVLVMAPHPDDFDVIAVSLKLLEQRGNKIIVAVMGSGWSVIENDSGDMLSSDSTKKIVEEELLASCAGFGLSSENVHLLRLREDSSGDIKNRPDNYDLVAAIIKEIQPQLIFMPHWNDSSHDHRLCCTMVWEVLENMHLEIPVFHYFTPHTRTMYRQLYTVFTAEEAAWKTLLLTNHKSQDQRYMHQYGRTFTDKIIQMNLELGKDVKKGDYAEAFEIKFVTNSMK